MIAKRFKRRRVKCNLAYLQLYLIDLISFVEILIGLGLIFCLKTTPFYFLLPWDYSKKIFTAILSLFTQFSHFVCKFNAKIYKKVPQLN